MTESTITKRKIRCGWCIANDHDHCILAIEMIAGTAKQKNRAKYPWTCPCFCNKTPELMGRTRCVLCGRRNVRIDESWHCVDSEDCAAHRKRRRSSNRSMRMIDELREVLKCSYTDEETPKVRNPPLSSKAKTKPREGKCLCCGGSTKGGKFLPGHDSRYVSQQAQAYVSYDNRGGDQVLAAVSGKSPATDIYDTVEALGPKLHGKFVKTVEKLRAQATVDAS